MPEPALATILPLTDYFEIESKRVGARFGVFVTRPPEYDTESDKQFEVLYAPDGNASLGLLSPMLPLSKDPILSVRPILQVMVSYLGAEALDANRTRNRDLVPPGEPIAPEMRSTIEAYVEQGIFTREAADDYLLSLRATYADHFLLFFEEELHPAIASRYRVAPGPCGLFGFSYGGLFVLYAMLRGSPMFNKYGAGTPGIATAESTVFALLRDRCAEQAGFDDVQLYITVSDLELVGPSQIYRTVGRHILSFIDDLYRLQPDGLKFDIRIVPEHTHYTGMAMSHLLFLRACYPVA